MRGMKAFFKKYSIDFKEVLEKNENKHLITFTQEDKEKFDRENGEFSKYIKSLPLNFYEEDVDIEVLCCFMENNEK